jgi:hypothetical protein
MNKKDTALALEQQLLKNLQDRAFLSITAGALLWQIRQGEFYKAWQFSDLGSYVEARCGLHERTARYYIRVYEVFVRKHNVPTPQLVKLGTAKLRALAPIVTAKNMGKWLAYAEKHTVREVELQVSKQITPQQKEAAGIKSALTILVTDEQRQVIQQAIEEVQNQTGYDGAGDALELACANALSGPITHALVLSWEQVQGLHTAVQDLWEIMGTHPELTDQIQPIQQKIIAVLPQQQGKAA